MSPSAARLFPSVPATEGAILLSVVQADGCIAYLKDRVEITEEFLEIARAGKPPEKRFRSSSHWLIWRRSRS